MSLSQKFAQTTVVLYQQENFVKGVQQDCQEFLNYIVNDINDLLIAKIRQANPSGPRERVTALNLRLG
jgi:ubiquitin C-terminal hydrolase